MENTIVQENQENGYYQPIAKEFYQIPLQNIEVFRNKIEKLNRKAVKLGCLPIQIIIVGESEIKQPNKTVIKYTHVKIEGESPVLNGFKFIATIDHLVGEGNLIRSIPNEEIPSKYRTISTNCEHCNVNRYRKDTYLIKEEATGNIIQLGKTCLKDFFGHGNPQNMARYAEYLAEAGSLAESSYSSSGSKYFELEEYLNYVSEMVIRYGYLSKTKANELNEPYDYIKFPSTGSRALNEMFPNIHDKTHVKIYPSCEAIELTSKAMEWLDSWKNNEGLNDFLYNVKTICTVTSIEYKHIGIASALIGAYLRDLDKEKERIAEGKEKENKKPSEYMGMVGVRQEFTLKVNKIIVTDGYMGNSAYIHIMEDMEGNEFTWFSSGNCLEEDKTYKVKASVKSHEEYKGVKKTIVTRAKAEEIE